MPLRLDSGCLSNDAVDNCVLNAFTRLVLPLSTCPNTPTLIFNILNNNSLPIYGRGLNSREWIYVEDHCKGLFAIYKKGKCGESYNIGTNKNINNLNILKKYSNESFKLKLDELNICLYGSLISKWDGTSFLNIFESQSYDKKKLKNSKGKLEPLYKT